MSNTKEKSKSLRERIADLVNEIEGATELAFAPEIAQVRNGLVVAHQWLENFESQPDPLEGVEPKVVPGEQESAPVESTPVNGAPAKSEEQTAQSDSNQNNG